MMMSLLQPHEVGFEFSILKKQTSKTINEAKTVKREARNAPLL